VANLAWKTLQQLLPLAHLALVQHGGHFLVQGPQFLHDRCPSVLSNLIQPLHVSQKNGFHLIALPLRQIQARTESRQHLFHNRHGRRWALPFEMPDHQQRNGSAAEHACQQNDQSEEGHSPVVQPAEQDHRAVETFVLVHFAAHEIASAI